MTNFSILIEIEKTFRNVFFGFFGGFTKSDFRLFELPADLLLANQLPICKKTKPFLINRSLKSANTKLFYLFNKEDLHCMKRLVNEIYIFLEFKFRS